MPYLDNRDPVHGEGLLFVDEVISSPLLLLLLLLLLPATL
jgi:hypothetical protein